ncbi:hypothetical protein F383_32859 [Gossypium arboreum]|nr:hypothetical protein F383_32859 [Gossypium arboreum]
MDLAQTGNPIRI